MNYQALLKLAIQAAFDAGKKIMEIYNTDFSVEIKSDNTPVTAADKASSQTILNILLQSNIPVISEEEEIAHYSVRKNYSHLWLIDPLDGTKEFVKRNGEFAVNIALIENQKPVIGVIYAPVLQTIYFACKDFGAFKFHFQENFLGENSDEVFQLAQRLPLQKLPKNYTVVASRSHLSREINQHIDYLKNLYGVVDMINVGSSIKQCWVAEGKAHEYPRFGTTMEWDTAAGQCILENANAQLIDLETHLPMRYNKESLKNNFFIAKQV